MSAASALERVVRAERPRVLAALVGMLRDFELAEDALQDACAEAARRWPSTGVPTRPADWLVAVARDRAIDRLRRQRAAGLKYEQLVADAQAQHLMDLPRTGSPSSATSAWA